MGPGFGWIVRAQFALLVLLLLLLLRFSPLSHYHAAEHMVVHALEQGEPLTVEAAARMSRVHWRCGSNLVAGVAIVVLALASGFDWRWFAVAVALLPWSWRIGAGAQRYFATRPPGVKHLQSAVRAGEQLLSRYIAGGPRVPGLLGRLWYSGLLQVGVGLALAYGAWHLLERLLLATVVR